MMSDKPKTAHYARRITPAERLFTRSPFSTVVMVARIHGAVSETMLQNAVHKVQGRHSLLRVRIQEDPDHVPWFTSEGAKDIPVEIVPREAEDHWIKVHQAAVQVPFDFEERPPIRFILVQSPEVSELMILCHHIICDGLSLAHLAHDLMRHLGDPERAVAVLPDPAPVDRDTIPGDVKLNPIIRFFINRLNKQWQKDKVVFDHEDYKNLCAAYWAHYTHEICVAELSEAQTSALVERCRKESVTVNSALAAAFVGAQSVVQGPKPYHASLGIAGSVRERLQRPVGEAMGFYAGVVTLNDAYDNGIGFWENARRLHGKVKPLFTDKNLFKDLLLWCYLDPSILEAINFKKLGGLVPVNFTRHKKLSAFSQQDDVVLSVLKRDKMESLNHIIMGTAVTNLTRMDFPRQYGPLVLDRLLMQPGGAFPLSNVNLVLGAVTCCGKLSLVLEFAAEVIDVDTVETIKDQALAFLLGG